MLIAVQVAPMLQKAKHLPPATHPRRLPILPPAAPLRMHPHLRHHSLVKHTALLLVPKGYNMF